ncbi:MAG TPA: flagellar hook-basal body complex protein FliE [Bacillota bacterium]
MADPLTPSLLVGPALSAWPSRQLTFRDETEAAQAVRPADVAEQFGEALARALDRVNRYQHEADAAAEAFATGASRDVAALMIATEQAHLALQMALAVRNKALEAYQEIMRMPL